MDTFHVHKEFRINSATIQPGRARSISALHCLRECLDTCGCVAVNTRKKEPYVCEIVLHDNMNIVKKMPDTNWDVYSFIYV